MEKSIAAEGTVS